MKDDEQMALQACEIGCAMRPGGARRASTRGESIMIPSLSFYVVMQ